MDCYWYRRPGGIIYQWASSRLFIPRGDNVFPLCIKWASRAFLTASRLLRMSSSGIRMTSLIECLASLIKMQGDRSGITELLVVQDESAVFSKTFIYSVVGIWSLWCTSIYINFVAAGWVVNEFSLFISCGKNVICLAFLEKRTGEN